jgi:hypothetical protein
MKKTRLLEIIKEEITSALNEAGLYNLKNATDTKKGLPQTMDPDDATEKSPDFLRKYKKVSEVALEEDLLNEAPIYDVSDMEGFKSTLNKFREEGISKSKALNLLLKKLEDEGTVDTNALSKEYNVDTATFNNQEIRKFLNRPEGEAFIDKKTGDELIDFTPLLSKSNKPKGKKADGTSEPKEKTALPDSGIKRPESKIEPKKTEKTEPKAEPKKAEPAKAERGPSEKSLERGSKLADKKDDLLNGLNKVKGEMKTMASKLSTLKGAEYDALVTKLKAKTAEKNDIQKQIDAL